MRISVTTALIVILYAAVWADMANDWWTQADLSQGMLLPPLALMVAWIERKNIFGKLAKPDNRGLLLTAFACVVFTFGKLASEDFMSRISSVLLLAGLIWTFWGAQRLRALAFPLLLLAAMVPLPALLYNTLAAPLQLFASDVASQLAEFCGVSVYRDGNIIQLAHTSLGVAEACSGLSCLSALMVGSLLMGYLLCGGSWLGRFILFACSIPLAIAVNVLRITGTAVLADYSAEWASGFYHLFAGWLVFVVGSLGLYLIARFVRRFVEPQTV
jgi:exosortase